MVPPCHLPLLLLFFLPLLFSAPSAAQLQEACKASRDPSKCEVALSSETGQLAVVPTPIQSIELALQASQRKFDVVKEMVKELEELAPTSSNRNLTHAAKGCLEGLDISGHRVNLTAVELRRGRSKDARSWMSAAFSYQYGCRAGFLKFVDVTPKVNETLSLFDSLVELSTIALDMVVNYDVFGNNTASWNTPKTERDGFWEPVGASKPDFKGGVPKDLKANVTVCKDGSCNYIKVQEAVDATPNNLFEGKFVISIKAGVYEEIVRVPFEKRNVVFLGDGIGKTVITGSLNVGMQGLFTSETATVGVFGDGFMASNLTIQNTAGSDAQQAVAFRSDSDLSVIEDCEILGNQDTLYARSSRQYYKSCRIQGNVDFIFGDAAAFFQDCAILIAPRTSNPGKGSNNPVTAHGRVDAAQSTGFVFKDCVVDGTKEYVELYHSNPSVHKSFLGRPWKEFSRTVFIHCNLEAVIAPEGWMHWQGEFALETLYYGEFENRGPGADMSKRVNWTSQIPPEHVGIYSVQNFIQGEEWIPASL